MLNVQEQGDPRVTPIRPWRTNTTFSFTAKEIAGLPIPEDRDREYYYDLRQKGLMLTVTRNGIKSFCVRRKFQGRAVRVTIGQFPDYSVEEARNKALEIIASFARGINPNIEKNAISHEETFGAFFKQYMEKYSMVQKRSWKSDQAQVNRYLKDWFNLKLSAITKKDVLARHLKITEQHGVYAANRLLSCIQTIYNKAIEWGWKGENPAKDIRKNREKSRDRFLQPNEIPLFLNALKKEKNQIAADYLRVSLQTGARKSNVLAMRWEQVNFEAKTWRIPETKNGDPITIALTPSIIKILENRKKKNLKLFKTESEWVFPGEDAKTHLKDPKKAWQRVLNTAKIKDLRIHDLRRTFGSYMAAQGATTAIIGKSLGHKSQQSTKVYERLNLDPVRAFVGKTESIFNLK